MYRPSEFYTVPRQRHPIWVAIPAALGVQRHQRMWFLLEGRVAGIGKGPLVRLPLRGPEQRVYPLTAQRRKYSVCKEYIDDDKYNDNNDDKNNNDNKK